MANTISRKRSVNASSSKPLEKPQPGYKYFRLETEIRFYELEDIDNTEDGEEAQILITHDKSLVVSKQNLVKRKFPYIITFNHEGPVVLRTMCDLTCGVFEHLEITSPMDMDQIIACMQRILTGTALKQYKVDLRVCKESAKDLAGDKWTLSDLKALSTEKL